MKITKTNLAGLLIIEPAVYEDERGYFMESFSRSALKQYCDINFIQDNEAYSQRGVLRGLHYQIPPIAQSKLVRVAIGSVLDVVVDIRPESETYGQSFSIVLSGENKKQLLVPRGFAHGYVVLSEHAYFLYKVDNVYSKEHEAGIKYDDEALGIDWIIPNDQLIISDKDQVQPLFSQHTPYN